MSLRERAALCAAKTLGGVNALMAAGMALAGGVFVLGSLACSDITGAAYPMAREDSLALVEIFRANGFRVSAMRSAVEVGPDGRVLKLALPGQGVEVLPPEIGALDRMHTLDLGENKLDSLPLEMEKLVSLATLDLHHNGLSRLPDGLRFESLRVADLRDNHLTALPGNFDVTSVERLDLSGNQLTALPPDFRYLTRLTVLDLRQNHLESLDSGLGLLVNLATLDLSHNRLSALPPSLAGLDPAFLDVGFNRLCYPARAEADSATAALIDWLDAKDRDWRKDQNCP